MLKDLLGKQLVVGDHVVRAIILNKSPALVVSVVTDIRDGKLYLNNSPQPIRYTDRLAVIDL